MDNINGNGQPTASKLRIRITVNGNTVLNTINANMDINQYTFEISEWANFNVQVGDNVKLEYIVEGSSGNTIGQSTGHTTTGTSGVTATINPTAPNTQELFRDNITTNFNVGYTWTHNFVIENGKNYAFYCSYFQ